MLEQEYANLLLCLIQCVCQQKRAAKRDVAPVFCSSFINFQSRIISHAIVNPTTHSSPGWEELLPKVSGPHCQTEYQISVDNTNVGIGYVENEFKIAQNDFNRTSRTICPLFICKKTDGMLKAYSILLDIFFYLW